jgi:ketosteroid isomerase-like protein
MRFFKSFTLFLLIPLFAQSSDEKDAIATVQKTFNAMAAHDAETIRATMLPDARLYSVRNEAAPASTAVDDFANQIAALKGDLLERFTSQPRVSIRGRMAQVWGEYEFLRDGKFNHCGVDSVSLLKTAEGWKIATIVYTSETTGCKGQ